MARAWNALRRRSRRSLHRRLLLAALAVVAPLLVGAALCVTLLARSSDDYNALAREMAREADHSVALLQDLNDAQDAGSRYMEGGEREDLVEFQALRARIDRRFGEGGDYDVRLEAQALSQADRAWEIAKWRAAAFRPGLAGVERDGVDPEDRFEEAIDGALAGVRGLLRRSETEMRSDLAAAERLERFNMLLGLSAIALALIAAGFVAERVSRGLIKPLAELVRGARSLGSGHLGHRVVPDSTAELREVGETFNSMAEALQQHRDELERYAFSDSLTGLANRALFEDRTRHALARVGRSGERVAVLVVDIDGFKLVNDGLGHSCGDRLLVEAARRMAGSLRPTDTLARLAGDEFAVLLEGVRGLDDTLGAAERLRRSFAAPFVVKQADVVVTASVGIALSNEAVREASELLRRADLAMYRVKARGKNACEFFDPEMDDQATERLDMLNALRGAVERDELVVHYQPIVDLDSGGVRAAEALLRWDRSGHGLVPPAQFIPLAEETGLIVALGAWVLRTACTEAAGWRAPGDRAVPVTVNVSARQLLDPDFEATVAGALAASGLASAELILEVTESSLMQDAPAAIAKLHRISSTGVRIALDDFGEGYSSLGQLHGLPIDLLKIARPFVNQLTRDGHGPALVRGVMELARGLDLLLVAEGIELPEQRDLLRDLDCTLGQGYLFARPMDGLALRRLLAAQRPNYAGT